MLTNRSKTLSGYTGIDFFRLTAALLVITIHTSPLSDISDTGNFILTRVAARMAVPFFFMASGFFMLNEDGRARRLKQFLKRTALIYAAAIMLYLPVNIYSGYFQADSPALELIKDIFFNGAFYHLWYLPAAMLGGWLAWLMINKLGYKKAVCLGLVLYAFGLLGDSYYGLTLTLPALDWLYAHMFKIFDYTRNGLFFAPIFFILGGLARKTDISRKTSAYIFIFSAAVMLSEALILREINFQRHDSMYIMLIPCSFFLFNLLKSIKGKRSERLRDISLCVYIIHPMIIILLRFMAKAAGLEKIILDNALIFFSITALLSCACAYLYTVIKSKIDLIPAKQSAPARAWLEIYPERLRDNLEKLLAMLYTDCGLIAVIKADAYGLGAYRIARYLSGSGISSFAVSTMDEGIMLRRKGIKGEILILGYTPIQQAKKLYKYRLTQTAVDCSYAQKLNASGYKLNIHIKIDTGMTRLGVPYSDKQAAADIFTLRNLKITGIYTHLCVSYSSAPDDRAFSLLQIKRFDETLDYLKKQGAVLPKTHLQSSYGILNYPQLKYGCVRSGAILFGALDYADTIVKPDIRPIFSLKSRIALIKRIKAGETVGYGREFTASRDSVIAVLPIGYADGIPCSFSCGAGEVLVRGQRARTAGRICMDQMMLDITDIPDVRVQDAVTFIGEDAGEEISPSDMAKSAGISVNELLSRFGSRLERIYI